MTAAEYPLDRARNGSNAQITSKVEDADGAGESCSLVCPACGGENAPDAVFCANPACHKALGDFKYVLEELRSEAQWHEALAEKITVFIGKPHFLAVHGLWFALWVVINSGIIAFIRKFDEYPYGLLGIILAAEAVVITGVVLISNNRQSAHADKRAELDYEVNVRTYRQITDTETTLKAILERLDRLERISCLIEASEHVRGTGGTT
jgi:uncharacterized membrane protein